ncbi:PAB-dependent poly-A-specific ribonuclease subunit PAN2, partial [Suillus occidentalis]
RGHDFPDPLVKVYDLRTMRPLPPIPFQDGPAFIDILPKHSSSLVVTSAQGLVNVVDVSDYSNVSGFYQLETTSYISSTAVSSNGSFLAFGDALGAIHLMTAIAEDAEPLFNGFEGQPIEWADAPEALPDINWTDSTPLNSIGMPHYNTLLLSSWTPQFLPRSGILSPPPPKIPPQVLSTMKMNDNIAYAALPKELRGRRNRVPVTAAKDQGRFRSGKGRRDDLELEALSIDDSVEEVPRIYRKVEIEYSKFGVEDFDFGFYNKTPYSGLETHILNSYTNSMLQVMHYTLPIRRLAKSHITTNCPREHCLLCELGFVARMLEDAGGTNCQGGNFCKTSTYAHMIQSFHRFLVDHLSLEGNSFPHNPRLIHQPFQEDTHSPAAAPITQLLGIDAKNVITCMSCKAVREKENMTQLSLRTCKQFGAFSSRRSIPSSDLPTCACGHASVYNEDNMKLWLDNRQVRGEVDGVDEAMGLRSFMVCIGHGSNQIMTKERHSHLRIGRPNIKSAWFLFNDFVRRLSFPNTWKVPAILYFERVDVREQLDYSGLPDQLDPSILSLDTSISFVSMQQEETEYRSDGTNRVIRPARLSLARVSVLRVMAPKEGVPFIDDHIHTSEVIVDYLTDVFWYLNSVTLIRICRGYTLTPLKLVYKKLRVLVDRGCIFIGHGLSKDFRIINIFVPPEQVIDTVDLYFLHTRQRRLSLRFLSWFVLHEHIQTDTHDSIEDARSALRLYKAYHDFEERGVFDEKLEELYREGKQYNWKPPPQTGARLSTTRSPVPAAQASPVAQFPMTSQNFARSPFNAVNFPISNPAFFAPPDMGQFGVGGQSQIWNSQRHR